MKIEKIFNTVISILSGTLLLGMVTVTFLQIVVRQFFDISLNWTDEVTQYFMTWLALLGSIWVTKNNRHLNTGFKMHRKLNERQICLIDGILALIIVGVAALVAYQSVMFSFLAMDVESLSLPWLKLGYVFIALPIFMLAVCYYYLKIFYKNFIRLFKKV
jgi:TRAP-type C4-dicarboxylate transport system permease small subunit